MWPAKLKVLPWPPRSLATLELDKSRYSTFCFNLSQMESIHVDRVDPPENYKTIQWNIVHQFSATFLMACPISGIYDIWISIGFWMKGKTTIIPYSLGYSTLFHLSPHSLLNLLPLSPHSQSTLIPLSPYSLPTVFQMVENDPKLPKWSKMVQNGFKWQHIIVLFNLI